MPKRDESVELLCIDGRMAGHKIAQPGTEFAWVETTPMPKHNDKGEWNGQTWYRLYRDEELGLVWKHFNGPSRIVD